MNEQSVSPEKIRLPRAAQLPVPARALITMIILTMGIAMAGAAGQLIVHDIIPTFFSGPSEEEAAMGHAGHGSLPGPALGLPLETDLPGVGDLFAGEVVDAQKAESPLYKDEQFVWLLKWTHIHLFGMNMIFIFMGSITLFLDLSTKVRTCLVVLPFFGVVTDIGAMWLKVYVSKGFFWLHIPAGGVFVGIFFFTASRALWEMWLREKK